MILKDDAIVLRAIEQKDRDLLLDMINDPEIESCVVGWSQPVSSKQQEEWINNIQSDKAIRFAIDSGNGIVGVAIISPIDYKNSTANLNIKLPKKERGKGYARKTISLLLGYCYDELNINCVTANVIENNESSKRLWETLGFKKDGLLRSRVYKEGQYRNLVAYSLLKEEYAGK